MGMFDGLTSGRRGLLSPPTERRTRSIDIPRSRGGVAETDAGSAPDRIDNLHPERRLATQSKPVPLPGQKPTTPAPLNQDLALFIHKMGPRPTSPPPVISPGRALPASPNRPPLSPAASMVSNASEISAPGHAFSGVLTDADIKDLTSG